MAEQAMLRAEGLTMRFGGVKAVEGVDFSIDEREMRCLIGPNGAGKSTFFRCLTKVHQPTAGRIFFKGKDITRAKTHEVARLGVGIKTQVPSVFDGLTVRENLWLAAALHRRGDDVDRAAQAAAARLDLRRILDLRLDRLSHGQRQWVELAMVVTSEPVLILLDEPTAGMTQAEVDHTVALIGELNKEAALIVVEHDMQFVRRIAQRITVFHQGRILIDDEAGAVLTNPKVAEVYLGRGAAA